MLTTILIMWFRQAAIPIGCCKISLNGSQYLKLVIQMATKRYDQLNYYSFCGGSDGTRTRGLWRDSLAFVLYLGVFEDNTRTFFTMLMVTEGN